MKEICAENLFAIERTNFFKISSWLSCILCIFSRKSRKKFEKIRSLDCEEVFSPNLFYWTCLYFYFTGKIQPGFYRLFSAHSGYSAEILATGLTRFSGVTSDTKQRRGTSSLIFLLLCPIDVTSIREIAGSGPLSLCRWRSIPNVATFRESTKVEN